MISNFVIIINSKLILLYLVLLYPNFFKFCNSMRTFHRIFLLLLSLISFPRIFLKITVQRCLFYVRRKFSPSAPERDLKRSMKAPP